MKKVLIPTKLDAAAAEILSSKGFKVVQDAEKPLPELAKDHPDTDVLIVRSENIGADIIDMLPKLRLVVRAGAGYNTIDIKHARRKNIDVMNTPGANSNAVAEEVIALMLAASRHVVKGDIITRSGGWEKKKLMGKEISGKTMGILGMGHIGKLVRKRLEGFDMKFLAYDPVLSADLADKLGVKLRSVEEIFSKSDFISLHIPETADTKGMINAKLFNLMKDGAMLINCARAGVINENDLRNAKKSRNIVFCNDVYPKDEAGEKSVADIADIMLPHLGASTFEANYNAAVKAAEQTVGFFEKGITGSVVNKGVPDGLDPKFQELAFAIAKLAHSYLGPDAALHQVETSFYGRLQPFAKWLLAPIVAGISPDFDIFMDASDAKAFLKDRGIMVVNREPDLGKKYGEAMTIDIVSGSDVLDKASVRGTIAENNLMISRINDFDKLYLEASGDYLLAEYRDQPGVIGKIASILGANDINIIDIRAPQNQSLDTALCVIKTNKVVPREIVSRIAADITAQKTFTVSFG